MHTERGYPRPYLRDGVSGLPIERQREILAAAGINVSDSRMLYIDKLTRAAVRTRNPAALKQRSFVLNPREPNETVCVAGLRVLGWTMSDIARAMLAAFERKATVFCADTGVLFSAALSAPELLEALASAEEAHRRGMVRDKQRRAVSASQRKRARDKAEKIALARPLWGDKNRTVAEIAAEIGLSRRTLYNALGPRFDPDAPFEEPARAIAT